MEGVYNIKVGLPNKLTHSKIERGREKMDDKLFPVTQELIQAKDVRNRDKSQLVATSMNLMLEVVCDTLAGKVILTDNLPAYLIGKNKHLDDMRFNLRVRLENNNDILEFMDSFSQNIKKLWEEKKTYIDYRITSWSEYNWGGGIFGDDFLGFIEDSTEEHKSLDEHVIYRVLFYCNSNKDWFYLCTFYLYVLYDKLPHPQPVMPDTIYSPTTNQQSFKTNIDLVDFLGKNVNFRYSDEVEGARTIGFIMDSRKLLVLECSDLPIITNTNKVPII